MTPEAVAKFRSALSDTIPNLRAFGRALSGNRDMADDLVQETLVKAWQNRESFAEGSNLKAWLFTILRNTYLSDLRKRKREVADSDGLIAGMVGVPDGQSSHMELVDFAKAFQKLPPDQREALVLVGAEGLPYEEVASMCGCPVGTIKSRVNRARQRLSELLAEVPADQQ